MWDPSHICDLWGAGRRCGQTWLNISPTILKKYPRQSRSDKVLLGRGGDPNDPGSPNYMLQGIVLNTMVKTHGGVQSMRSGRHCCHPILQMRQLRHKATRRGAHPSWYVVELGFEPSSESFFFFLLFGVAPVAYGRSQARGGTGAAAASPCHSHSHARSELHQ